MLGLIEERNTFRLVSNSCLPPERRFLEQLSRQDIRLSFWAIPAKTRLPHGHALNYVQAMTRGDYFCFMDSDIFATGCFFGRIHPVSSVASALFQALQSG